METERVRKAYRAASDAWDRLERSKDLDFILRQRFSVEPTVEDIAAIVRWADSYQQAALIAAVQSVEASE